MRHRTGRALLLPALVIGGVVSDANGARAEAEEKRYAIAGVGDLVTLGTAGSSTTRPAAGARARITYGVTDEFELGGHLSFVTPGTVAFAQAELEQLDGTLYVDAAVGEIGAEATWAPDVGYARIFDRTRPVVGLYAGVGLRALTRQLLLNDNDMTLLVPDNDFVAFPTAGVRLGVEHRFGVGFIVGLHVEVGTGGSTYQHAGLQLELAWLRY
jgi:hypothetical protein